MTTIVQAKSRIDFKEIANLAKAIWTEHYTSIIGSEQVEYMLEKFQSAWAIEDQTKNGMHYYLLKHQDRPVGYFSFSIKDDYLFLSKLYVLSELRGLGIGKVALLSIEEQTKNFGCRYIKLTVNRHNTNAIRAYEKMGFETKGPWVQDIGNGFVMDDYVMEKVV